MQPTPTNIEWVSFQKLALAAYSAPLRRIVVSGVTGVGSTKQGKRVANLLAGSYDRVLQIDCSPWFDVEYHKKYIGHEDEKGNFHPGELMLFWDRCRQHPEQKFVAVVDNFDKINPETFFGPALWEALSAKKNRGRSGRENCGNAGQFLYDFDHAFWPGSGSRIQWRTFQTTRRPGSARTLVPAIWWPGCDCRNRAPKKVRKDLPHFGIRHKCTAFCFVS